MSVNVSPEEQEQILQTIEMFEVIAQANPHDCQSLEILKDAYWKLGRQKEALTVTRKLADTYTSMGQYSSALQEYEGILQKEPDSPDVAALLGEVDRQAAAGRQHERPVRARRREHRARFRLALAGRRPHHHRRHAQVREARTSAIPSTTTATSRSRNFSSSTGSRPRKWCKHALERVQKTNKTLGGQALAASLIDEIAKSHVVSLEASSAASSTAPNSRYIPLDYYDVDRQIVKMLPESLTLGRLIAPFDMISRTIMIAMANPFDVMGKEAVQQLLDYNIQWHLAAPAAICKVLARYLPAGCARLITAADEHQIIR